MIIFKGSYPRLTTNRFQLNNLRSLNPMTAFSYQIIRRPRRKTLAISVSPDCSVRVLAPARLPEREIVALVKKKSEWIQKTLTLLDQRRQAVQHKQYISGDVFNYLGKNYSLHIHDGSDGQPVKLKNGQFQVHLPSEMDHKIRQRSVIELLTAWYQEHAYARLSRETARLGQRIGVTPRSIGIKNYTSRWGSCHPDGRIYYNWRLIMAPPSIVEYVVVHELCHLVHGNHSKKYWNLVSSILPDYKDRRKWLRLNGFSLTV